MGLAVSVCQAVTQIQEMTLTFIPKIIALVLVMVGARGCSPISSCTPRSCTRASPSSWGAEVESLLRQIGEEQVAAFFLVRARVSPLFLLGPLFSARQVPSRVRDIVAVALAVGYSPIALRGVRLDLDPIGLGEIMLKELVVGLARP